MLPVPNRIPRPEYVGKSTAQEGTEPWVQTPQVIEKMRVAGQKGGIGVSVHTIDVGRDIDVDDVAVGDHRRVGDAVADDLVE